MPKGKIYVKTTIVVEQAVPFDLDHYPSLEDMTQPMSLNEAIDYERNVEQFEAVTSFIDALESQGPTSVGKEVWFKADED